jgi:hypothetical protein
LLNNTPLETVDLGYADLAGAVAAARARDPGVFDKVFPFHPWENHKAIQVCPAA